jgi:hypothetical protein
MMIFIVMETKKIVNCIFVLLFLSLVKLSKCIENNHHLSLSHSSLQPREDRSLQSSSSFSTAIAKLTASNAAARTFFGDDYAVSTSNHRIVVGAYGYNSGR